MNFQLPQIREDDLTNRREIRRILEALYQLSEQIRYFSMNIGEENLSEALRSSLTEQSAALSQLNREVKNGITGAMSRIRQQSDEISLMVSRNDYVEAMDGMGALLAELSSAVTQTAQSVASTVSQTVFNEKTGALEQSISSVTQTANDLTLNFSSVQSTAESNREAISEISEYIRFEGANIYLGKSTSPLILHIANDRISYKFNNLETTFFADKRLVISYNGSAQRLDIGVTGEDPYLNIYDEDGVLSLSLTKTGIEFGGGARLTPYAAGTLKGLAVSL